MTIISGNHNALPQYNPVSNAIDKKTLPVFGTLMASALEKTTAVQSATAVVAPTDTSFVSTLNSALRDYGISVPPSLRITPGPNGYELSGDNRNVKFQTMLKDRPDLQAGMSSLIGQAQVDRKDALDSVMDTFGGSNPSSAIKDFLSNFENAEKSKGFSIKFNGAETSVEEFGDQGWQPVKDKKSFMMDLIEAYTAYLQNTQVRSTSDKDDSDAQAQMKEKLDEARRS